MGKRFLLYTILCSVSLTLAARNYTSQIRDVRMLKNGGQIEISFVVDRIDLSSNDRVVLIPVIFDGDDHWKELERLTLVGRKRRSYDKLSGLASSSSEQGKQIVVGKGDAVSYNTTLPYEDWMAYVSLALVEQVSGCCSTTELPLRVVSKPQLLNFVLTPYYDSNDMIYELTALEKYDIDNAFLHPMEDYDKRYDVLKHDRENATSKILFKVGESVIESDLGDNARVMQAFKGAFNMIDQDSLAILKKIVIAAYASPEGSLVKNTRLAHDRAEAVKRYLLSIMENPDESIFELINGREDWDGLRSSVVKSNMDDKDEVLKIIDSYTMEQEVRKQKLKALSKGEPYRYMLENLYPPLRNGGYLQIFYEVKRRAAVVAHDAQGREVWVDPDSPRNLCVTAINKALPMIKAGNYQAALPLLLQYKSDARTWNYLGVVYMMLGDYPTAVTYLKEADQKGDANAAKNLEQVEFIMSNT